MLHHIVLMKFKDGVADEAVDQLEQMLDALPDKIIEIQTYEFGRDILRSERSYDFALVSGFANMDAMQRYQTHPAHKKVIAHLQTVCDDIRAVDFETVYTPPDTLATPLVISLVCSANASSESFPLLMKLPSSLCLASSTIRGRWSRRRC